MVIGWIGWFGVLVDDVEMVIGVDMMEIGEMDMGGSLLKICGFCWFGEGDGLLVFVGWNDG